MVGDSADEKHVWTADGRRLAYEVSGAPDGVCVFLLHGTPGSRSGPRPRNIKLERLGIRLVSYDRPGYGQSDRHPGRSVRSAAADVATIADDLRIDRFAVVGRSGGGPHALACAAVLGSRVTRAAALVSIAPHDAPDLKWFSGMNDGNLREYESVDRGLREGRPEVRHDHQGLPTNADTLLESIREGLAVSDRRVVEDPAMRRLLLNTYTEGLRQGQAGWIDDGLAFRRPWEIDLGAIVSPVRIWHGADDKFSPTNHSRWLARHIPGAELVIRPDVGHFGAVEVLPEILPWLATPTESRRRLPTG